VEPTERDANAARKSRLQWRHIVAALLAIAAFLIPAQAFGAGSPQGDDAGAWPAGWGKYTKSNGDAIMDVNGDQNPRDSDLSSDCYTSGCTGTAPTVLFAADGTNVFFRMRVWGNPADPTKGGIASSAYLVQIARQVNGVDVVSAVVGVNGKPTSTDYVYVANAPGTSVTEIYTTPFDTSGGRDSRGVRVVPTGSGDYWLDFQVPLARLTQISGGTITASTPVKLYYGTSEAANLATINKDLMLGSVTTIDFSGLSTITLSPSSLGLSRTLAHVSGPTTPKPGQTTVYDVTVTASNPGGGQLDNLVVTGNAGVRGVIQQLTIASPMTGSSTSGSFTWNIGELAGGQTRTATVRVAITPTLADAGSTVVVLTDLSATGTDTSSNTSRTATAPELTAGPVPPNTTPVAGNDTATTQEDNAVTIDVRANDSDADGDALTVTVATAPANGSAVVSNGSIVYTPTVNWHGTDSFTYQVCDPSNACATATVSVTVQSVNDAPVASGATVSTYEDTPLNGAATATDVDGDTLTFTVSTPAQHGTVVMSPSGSYTYTPTANWSGSDSFAFRACDPSNACSIATVTVTVEPVNDGPIANDDTATVDEDGSVDVDVRANDIDVDGDTLTVSIVGTPSNGAASVVGGKVRFVPAANFNGTASVTYRVCDPSNACDAATITVTVTPVNDAPVAANDTSTVAEDGSVDVDVLANDVDVDGDTLTVSIVGTPSNGAASVVGGKVRFVPAANFNGTATVTYRVCDPSNACDEATISITVTPVNDAPVATTTSLTTAEDVPLSGTLGGSDVDGDPLTFSLVTAPAKGSLVVNSDGTFTYTPAANDSGSYTFTYEVCDPSSECDETTVTLVVNPVNDAPVATTTSLSTDEDVPLNGSLAGSDADGDSLTFSVVTGPAKGSLVVNADGTFTYTPAANDSGSYTFTYRVCDPSNACDESTVTLTVGPVNDAPIATTTSLSTDEDTVLQGSLGGTDVEGDTLTFSVVTGPAKGSLVVNADGTFTYTPAANDSGSYTFTYKVCDPSGACDESTVTIVVAAVNDAPVAVDDTVVATRPGPESFDVLGNDSDADGDDLTVSIVSGPEHGHAVVTAGKIVFTASPSHGGAETIVYRVCDPSNACSQATLTIKVPTVIAAPTAPVVEKADSDPLPSVVAPAPEAAPAIAAAAAQPEPQPAAAASEPAVAAAGARAGELPRTGIAIVGSATVAVMLLAFGLVLVQAATRRRHEGGEERVG